MTRPEPALARELEAALAWWQAAGVTHDFHDDATAWLAETPIAAVRVTATASAVGQRATTSAAAAGSEARPARAAPSAPAAAPPTSHRDRLGDSPPTDCAAFRSWWLAAPELETARGFPRIAPQGDAGAALMVLVPQPEEGDRERLLEGPQGRLLAAILAAMGLQEDALYLASALPCHTPMADVAALATEGWDTVTRHHVALAAPQRVLVLGTALGAMLGAAPENGLSEIGLEGRTIPVMVSETLEAMMHVPQLKARFWRRWMEWSAL